MRKLLTIIVVALTVSVTACGKGDSESPLVPSASTASGGAIAGGASISGTVVSGASSASLGVPIESPLAAPRGSPLVVSIVGTSMSVNVDSTGRFTLTNVPAGDLILAFVGNGIDARVMIRGVSDHDQIRITVNVHCGSAELDENEHERAGQTELEGRVASKNCTANQITVGTMTPTVVNLMGARIRHDGNTLTCADIQVNDRVEVHGIRNGSTINATDVNVKTDHGVPPVQHEVELKVTISLLAGACPSVTFTVSSTMVTTNAATKFDESACTALHNGDAVEVKGTKQTDGRVLASRVEKENDDEDDNEDDEKDEAEIRGIVTGAASGHACPAFTFTVGSTSVTTSARTKFEHTTCAGVINGISVKVEGTRTSPTAIAASEVEKR